MYNQNVGGSVVQRSLLEEIGKKSQNTIKLDTEYTKLNLSH